MSCRVQMSKWYGRGHLLVCMLVLLAAELAVKTLKYASTVHCTGLATLLKVGGESFLERSGRFFWLVE